MEPLTPWSRPINRSLPPELRAGDAHTWTVQTDLPVGSVLFYVLTGVIKGVPTRLYLGGNGADITTMADPSKVYSGVAVDPATGNATFTVTSVVSAAWKPGRYQWVALAIDALGNRYQLAEGEVRILPDPNGAVPADPRSYNERLLHQIRAVLADKAMDDVAMYKIGARELTKMPLMDLLKWEGLIEARVRNERIRSGQYVPTKTFGICFGGR